jgi:hypothetical protein
MYRQRFDSNAFVSTAYRKRVEALVRTVCAKYKLGRRSGDSLLTREVGSSLMEEGAVQSRFAALG